MKVYRGSSDRHKRSSAVVAAVVLALTVGLLALNAGTALAASGGKATSAGAQYSGVRVLKPAVPKKTNPPGGSNVSSAETGTPVTTASSGLPFTGISLAGTAVLGIGLVGLGVMLRQRGRRDES